MRRRSFDDRVRGLVSAGDGTRAGGAAFDAPLMDMVGRALAVPIPRRRALGAISGALLAGSAWRPGRASAAPQDCKAPTPKPCDHPGGARVCVREDFVCCSAPKCALACSPWEDCAAGGACSSSERMCGYPGGPFSDGSARPKFCFVEGPNSTFCNDYSGVVVKDGWCCRAGETCNSGKFGECTCTGEVCAGDKLCCQRGTFCVSQLLGDSFCVPGCGPNHDRKPCGNGVCCTPSEVCTFFGCICPPGKVHVGGDCVDPPKDEPGDPDPISQALGNFFGMMSASGSSHGGSRSRSVLARSAQSGSPAVNAALTAIAAVDGQALAAELAFSAGKRDPAFRRKVGVVRVKPPKVVAGPGLDAASAAAINRLLAAEAKAYALMTASAKALWRSRGARAKGQKSITKSQLRASARFAGQAVSALKRIQPLRAAAAKALTAGAVAEVIPTEAQVTAFLGTVRASGIPSYLRTPMAGLGVGSTDLKLLRTGLLRQLPVSGVRPALIAPLTDAGRAKELKTLTTAMSKFATRARRLG